MLIDIIFKVNKIYRNASLTLNSFHSLPENVVVVMSKSVIGLFEVINNRRKTSWLRIFTGAFASDFTLRQRAAEGRPKGWLVVINSGRRTECLTVYGRILSHSVAKSILNCHNLPNSCLDRTRGIMEQVAQNDTLLEVETAPLLPVLRRQRIAEFLHHHGAVTLQQLAEALHVSLSTLRRDLDALAEEGVVERTHGGAILRHLQYSTFEPNITAARDLSPQEKRLVGMAAAESLVPGQSVIFDSGSTVLEAARAVVARSIPIIAVTNDIEIAQILNASSLVQVHVFGGQLRPGSNTLVGEPVQNAARLIRADVLFFGAHAVTDNVVSETSPEVAAVKRALMRSATSCRLLVDSSKFRPRVFMTVCDMAEIAEVITDDGAPQEELERIRSAGVKLVIAKRPR